VVEHSKIISSRLGGATFEREHMRACGLILGRVSYRAWYILYTNDALASRIWILDSSIHQQSWISKLHMLISKLYLGVVPGSVLQDAVFKIVPASPALQCTQPQ
jgi:hypothetical protein